MLNGSLRLTAGTTAITVSAWAGKITSLCLGGREWLVQDLARRAQHMPGTAFNDTPMSGWDEMFPSITGRRYADHGELWTQLWETVAHSAPTLLIQRARGASVGYSFQRTIHVRPGGDIEILYEVEGTELEPFPYLWAAHPLFAFSAGSTIEIGNRVSRVYAVDDPEKPIAVEWPSGLVPLLEWVPPGHHRKYWVGDPGAVASVRLRHPDGSGIEVAWDRSALPYFGIWVDHGRFGADPVLGLEPSTGFYDDVDRAETNGTARRLGPGQRDGWSVRMRALAA